MWRLRTVKRSLVPSVCSWLRPSEQPSMWCSTQAQASALWVLPYLCREWNVEPLNIVFSNIYFVRNKMISLLGHSDVNEGYFMFMKWDLEIVQLCVIKMCEKCWCDLHAGCFYSWLSWSKWCVDTSPAGHTTQVCLSCQLFFFSFKIQKTYWLLKCH